MFSRKITKLLEYILYLRLRILGDLDRSNPDPLAQS